MMVWRDNPKDGVTFIHAVRYLQDFVGYTDWSHNSLKSYVFAQLMS